MDSHTLVWPLDLAVGVPCFGAAPGVGVLQKSDGCKFLGGCPCTRLQEVFEVKGGSANISTLHNTTKYTKLVHSDVPHAKIHKLGLNNTT